MEAHPRRATLLILLCLFTVVWFAGLDYRDLIRPDEGRYAEIAREMLATGDWLTPRLNGFKYFEKPALQYWATAGAFSLFGVDEWTARLWTALTGFGGVLLVYFTGMRLYGRRAGLYAAAVLAGSFLYAFIGHFNTLDMGLSFFLTLALCAFLLGQMETETRHRAPAGRGQHAWMLLAWAAAALAVLSKGLVGAVLPAGALVVYLLWQRDGTLLRRLHLLAGGAVFLALAAPWFIAVSLENKEFFHFFFIHEHFERFLTKQHGRYEPPWYFIPVLLAGMAPWTLSLLAALKAAFAKTTARFQPARFLLAWSAFILLFFSASGSKLPSYILPMLPALALLIGPYLAAAERRVLLWQGLPFAGVGLAILLLAPRTVNRASADLPHELLANYVGWIEWTGISLLAAALVSALFEWRGRRTAAVISLAAGGLALAQLPLTGHQELGSVYSAADIIKAVKPRLKPDLPFYSVNTFDHTLPFYLGRTVTMVHYRDELATAIDWEAHKFLPDMAAFERAWTAHAEAYAVFAPNDFRQLPAELKSSMQVLAQDPRRVIVARTPPAAP